MIARKSDRIRAMVICAGAMFLSILLGAWLTLEANAYQRVPGGCQDWQYDVLPTDYCLCNYGTPVNPGAPDFCE